MQRHATLFWVYVSLALIGLVWSWFYFLQYFSAADSILIGPFLKSAMANDASSGVAIDATVAGIVFAVMAVCRATSDCVRFPWLYVVICFLVGLCVAMPLYLAMSERAASKLVVGLAEGNN